MSGVWEPEITWLLKKIVKKDDIVLNLGAHLGYHTLDISKLVGKTGKVYAFEANPHTAKILNMNLEINHASNVKLYNKATYSKNTQLAFWSIYHHTGYSHAVSPLEKDI